MKRSIRPLSLLLRAAAPLALIAACQTESNVLSDRDTGSIHIQNGNRDLVTGDVTTFTLSTQDTFGRDAEVH